MQQEADKEMTNPDKPLHPLLKLQMYNWLMQLRENGVNMFGVRSDMVDEWSISKKQATELLSMFHNGELEKHYKSFHKGEI